MKKGFTIIEVLAVIVVMTLLTVLIVPNIINSVNNKRADVSEASKKIIYDATDLYVTANRVSFPIAEDATYCVKLETLVNNGNLVAPVKDLKSDKEIPLNYYVKVTLDSYEQYNYELVSECTEVGGAISDTTPPTIASVSLKTKTSNSITVVANGYDQESGISHYQFSKDDGKTWTKIQESNEYTFSNLSTGTYKIKSRVINGSYDNKLTNKNYKDSDTNEIDVTNVEVPTEVVENALTNTETAVGFDNTTVTPNVNEGFASTDVTPVSLEQNQLVENTPVEEVAPINDNVQEVVEDGFVPPQISADDENVIDSEETPVENTEVVNEVNPVEEVAPIENPVEEAGEVVNEVSPVEEVAPIETPVEETGEVVNEVSPVEEVAPIETPVEESGEVVNEVSPVEEVAPIENPVEESGEEVEDVVEDENVDINEEYEDTTLDNMFGEVKDARDVEDDMKEDIFSESEVQTDSINFEDEFDDSYEENDYVEESNNKDTTMMEVAKSMAGLIKQNKDLKTSNNDLVGKLERVNASRKNYVDKTKMLEEKVDILNTKNQSLDSKIIKLESRNEMLESKTHDQERVIESQRRELDNLRKQLEGKEELSRLLQDAKVMLEDNDASYDYEDDNYYRRAA